MRMGIGMMRTKRYYSRARDAEVVDGRMCELLSICAFISLDFAGLSGNLTLEGNLELSRLEMTRRARSCRRKDLT